MYYSDDTGILTAEKCSPDTFMLDAECAGTPYEIIYNVVFGVMVNDDPSTFNSDLTVNIEIGNTCLADTVAINHLLVGQQSVIQDQSGFTYVLSLPSGELLVEPILTQDYSFCPVMATLVETSATGVDPSLITFNPTTGSFVIDSADKMLHGVTMDFELTIKPALNTL